MSDYFGLKIPFCEATVTTADGSLVARGMGTFRLRHARQGSQSDG